MAVNAKDPKQRSLSFGTSRTVSVHRAAKLLDCSEKTVVRYIEKGLIIGYRAYEGAWWKIEYDSIVQFLSRMRTEPPC